MPHAVIDTNVLLIANCDHDGVSETCRETCITRLREQQLRGITVIDDGYRIVSEYLNKTRPNQPKGPGDVFLKWLLQNKSNTAHVSQITLNEPEPDRFDEFPDKALESQFDPPDRKFVAVANAHPAQPPIWQAADCKWLDWWIPLSAHGIKVNFLCPEDVCNFYVAKFPEKPMPELPE